MPRRLHAPALTGVTLSIYRSAKPRYLIGMSFCRQPPSVPAVRAPLFCIVLLGASLHAPAWDYEGHRIVTELALASVPTNFPAFALTSAARERIAFLSGEADRWRNTPDLPFKHHNDPDHYLDLDDLPLFGLKPEKVSPFRYEFLAQLAVARAANPTNFPPIDPLRNADKTRELVGFLPWTITEFQGKLKSAFSYLRTFERQGGTPEEIANAQANVVYLMGVMSHFVADAVQPLHTTKHYNGWVGDNPRGYPTNRTFHAWIDWGYLRKAGVKAEELLTRIRPARLLASPQWPGLSTNIFPAMMAYVQDSSMLVEPLYRLEKARKLSGIGAGSGDPGYDLITGQLVKGAQMLGDLWFTAWQLAPDDLFLERELARRTQAGATPARAP